MVSPTEQRIRITANSLLRSLERSTATAGEGEGDHLSALKKNATVKHVKQLITSLSNSDGSSSDLEQRLAKVEATLSLSSSTSSRPPPPPPIMIPNPHNPYEPPIPAPSPLDFLLPSTPSLPLSLSHPGSRAGSPAPSFASHRNLLRETGAAEYTPSQYAPSDYTPSSYTPTSGGKALKAEDYLSARGAGGGSEASLSPTRARALNARRERSRSTAGGPDDDYTPDAYSPVSVRSPSREVDLRREEEDEEDGLGLGNRSRSASRVKVEDVDQGVDEEAHFGAGAKPDFPGSATAVAEEEDPEAGIGFDGGVEDDDDPEAGGMNYVPPPASSGRSHSGSVSSPSRSRTFSPPPTSTLAPPPMSSRRTSVSSSNGSNGARASPPPTSAAAMRNRRPSAPPRRPIPTSTTSHNHERDREDLLSSTATGASTSDLLSHHHDLQNSLLTSLTGLSSQLKTNSQTFAENLDKDKAVLEAAKDKLEVNHERMKKEGGRLKEQKKRSRGTMCWTVAVIVSVLVAWVAMFLLIKVT